MKTYQEFINEGIRDKMTPKSEDDINKIIGDDWNVDLNKIISISINTRRKQPLVRVDSNIKYRYDKVFKRTILTGPLLYLLSFVQSYFELDAKKALEFIKKNTYKSVYKF